MKTILIIAVHGSGSSPELSNTVKSVKAYFESVADVITPHYNEKDSYQDTKAYFNTFAKEYSGYDTIAVIGISLGGFWAKYLANRIPGAKYIGLNPALNYYNTGNEADKIGLPVTIYVAKDDDVIDPSFAIAQYKSRGKVNVLPSGGHRLMNLLPELLPKIKMDILRYTL